MHAGSIHVPLLMFAEIPATRFRRCYVRMHMNYGRYRKELSRRRKSKSFSHTQRKHQNIMSRKPLRDDDNMSLIAKNYRVNGAHKCGTSADEKLSGLVRSIRGGKADSCGPKTSHSSSSERHKFLSILKSDTASEGEKHRSIDFIHESNA